MSSPRTIPAAGTVTTYPAGSSISSMLQNAAAAKSSSPPINPNKAVAVSTIGTMTRQDGAMDSLFMTDAEITARSQATKMATLSTRTAERRIQYEKDWAFVQDWVARLPKPSVTKHFGEFKLDADAIVDEALRRARQEATM